MRRIHSTFALLFFLFSYGPTGPRKYFTKPYSTLGKRQSFVLISSLFLLCYCFSFSAFCMIGTVSLLNTARLDHRIHIDQKNLCKRLYLEFWHIQAATGAIRHSLGAPSPTYMGLCRVASRGNCHQGGKSNIKKLLQLPKATPDKGATPKCWV